MQKHAPCHAALNNETKYLLSKKLQNSGTGTLGQKSKKCLLNNFEMLNTIKDN